MSSYKGKSIKNKSKTRQEVRNIQQAIKQEGNPIQDLLKQIKKEA